MNPRENLKEKKDLHNEILKEVKDLKQILVNHIKRRWGINFILIRPEIIIVRIS